MPEIRNVTSEHQAQAIGELTGTVKMMNSSVDNLRQSVDRLAEKAAFRSDVDELKIEMNERLSKIQRNIDVEKEKNDRIQKLFYVYSGGLAVIMFIWNYLDIPLKLTFGG